MISTARTQLALGQSGAVAKGATKPSKKRIRNFTADDRAAHRIFEKNRRECFRERLLELAGELPALAGQNSQRLSKHVVLGESIARHKHLRSVCHDALQDIRALLQERDELLAELNTWRSSAGVEPREPAIQEEKICSLAKLEGELVTSQSNGPDSSPGLGSGSPDSNTGNSANDGRPEVSHPQEDYTAETNSIGMECRDPINPTLISELGRDLATETEPLATDSTGHMSLAKNPQLDSSNLLTTDGLIQDQMAQFMPSKSPQTELIGPNVVQPQIQNDATFGIPDLAQGVLPSVEALMSPRNFDLSNFEFPISLTDTNFNQESFLQHNTSW